MHHLRLNDHSEAAAPNRAVSSFQYNPPNPATEKSIGSTLIRQIFKRRPAIDSSSAADQSRGQRGAVVGAGHHDNALAGMRKDQHVGLIADVLTPLHQRQVTAR